MAQNNSPPLLAVTSPSFSSNPTLVNELARSFPKLRVNREKKELRGQSLLSFLEGSEALLVGRGNDRCFCNGCLSSTDLYCKVWSGFGQYRFRVCKEARHSCWLSVRTNRRSVAELALCFLLGLAHHAFFRYFDLKQGLWIKEGGQELSAKSVGIIGCGNVGSELVKLLLPFGSSILINDIIDKNDFIRAQKERGQKIQWAATKEEIYASCDFISLHTPLSPDTRGMIDARALGQMKSSAFLINTSRGQVIDEGALKRALVQKQIAGAALDVFIEEPLQDEELLKISNLILSPHIGGSAKEAALAMGRAAIAELEKWKEGRGC